MLFRVRVRIGVLIGVSVLARRFVDRVAVMLHGRWNATPLRHGEHGSEKHEHCEDGRQDSVHTISD